MISNQERDTWSDYSLILKGKDRKAAIIKLDVTVPSYFDATINPKEVALKYCEVGSALSRTRCNKTIPATVELASDVKACIPGCTYTVRRHATPGCLRTTHAPTRRRQRHATEREL